LILNVTQCGVHPQTGAVGNCVSCGRGVCEACKVHINEADHCKECVEAGKIKGGVPTPKLQGPPMMPPPGAPLAPPPQWMRPPEVYFPPRPTEAPRPDLFKTGAGGALAIGISCLLIGIFSVLGLGLIFSTEWILVVIAGHLPFLLLLPSYLGLSKNYGVPSAMTRFMVLVVMLVVSLTIWAVMLVTRSGISSFSSGFFSFVMVIAVPPMLGVGFIVASTPLTLAAKFIPPGHEARMSMSRAGFFMWVSGILFLSFFGLLVAGWVTLAISMFHLHNALLKAPVPTEQAPPMALPPPGPSA